VGKISILDELAKIAPVTAVRGNVDREGACGKLPETEVVLVRRPLHLHAARPEDPAPRSRCRPNSLPCSHGHTHVPNFYTKKGVLYFNPGSCGPRRFELPVTWGLLTIEKNAHGDLEP
jgi:predicted phosphodiesterase